MGMMSDITSKYSSVEAWVYDAVVAPAVARSYLDRFKPTGLLDAGGARLLDVGCGGGQIALALARRFEGASFVGLDLSEDQIRRARRRIGALSNIDFVVGDALQLPFDDDEFDTVISVACIKHWPDKMRGLRECHRVLKPGGTFQLVEVDRNSTHSEVAWFSSDWSLPTSVRTFGAGLFRKHIANRSISVEEARDLLEVLDWASLELRRVDGTPAFVARCTK